MKSRSAVACVIALFVASACVQRSYSSSELESGPGIAERPQSGTELPNVDYVESEYVRFGFDLRTLRAGVVADDVMAETISGIGNITSKFRLKSSESLDAGMKWIGGKFTEIGKGVFRSSDGMRQFRIDQNSLMGRHAPGVPHVHFETYAPAANKPTANNHVVVDEK